MKRTIASVCAAAVLLVGGCSSSDGEEQGETGDTGSTIAQHMGLQQAGYDTNWTFLTADGETCTVEILLDTPLKVQDHENAGDVVAVNTAGSAGVKLPADVSDNCHDTAIDLLSDFE